MITLIHTCTDSLDILGPVNFIIEQSKGGIIVGCLNSKYNRLNKNVPPGSESMFDYDIKI